MSIAARRAAEAGELPGTELALGEAEEIAAARQVAGRHAAAIDIYGRIVAAVPDHAGALLALGKGLLDIGRPGEALGLLERAVAAADADPLALAYLAGAEALLDRPAEAEAAARRALALDPDCAVAERHLGLALQRQGRMAEAEAALQRALELAPGDVDSECRLADLRLAEGEPERALALLQAVLARAPHSAAAQAGLAAAQLALGDGVGAIAALGRAVALDPDNGQRALELGRLLLAAGEPRAAATHLEAAAARLPESGPAQAALAEALILCQRSGEAAQPCERAVALAPGDPASLLAFAALLDALDRPADAIDVCRHAAALAPAAPLVQRRLAEALLKTGDFAAGWPIWERAAAPRELPFRAWRGEPLAGERILVEGCDRPEDMLFFARLLPALAAAGGRVVLRAPPALGALFAGRPGIVALVAPEGPLPDCELAVGLDSLPRLLGLDLDRSAPALGWLRPPADRLAAWRERLRPLPAPRIALAWRTGALGDPRARLPLAELAPLLRGRSGSFLAVNPEDRRAEIDAAGLGGSLVDLGPELARAGERLWPELAALLDGVDLLITVDSPLAHLAGLLGRPAWVLLARPADWRWFRDLRDSPWYPSLRLLRQPVPGDWRQVVASAARRLAGEAAA
jgi:tetratricopeptide (TPR) repeat protein